MSPIIKVASWVIVLWGVFIAKPFLVPVLLAILVCFLLLPLHEFWVRHRLPEWAAILFSSLILCFPIVLFCIFIFSEVKTLSHDLPQLTESFKEHWQRLLSSSFIQNLGLSDSLELSSLHEKVGEGASHGVSVVLSSLRAVLESGAHLILVFLFAILMLASRKSFKSQIEKSINETKVLTEIVSLIEKFLFARLGIMIGVMIFDFIILKLFGAPYSFLLGALLGISTAVPIVGFIAAILPVIILQLASGHPPGPTGFLILTLYIVAFIESHFVTPKLLGKQLDLNLLVTFLALFAGELLWGIWGMVLSIPLLGILRIILEATPKNSKWAKFLANNHG